MASLAKPDRDAFAAVLVAAGKGLRAGQSLPKQFAGWRGRTVLYHAAEALQRAGADPLVIAIPQGADTPARAALEGLEGYRLVGGGATRQESVQRALAALADEAPQRVLVHDAARPDCPEDVVDRLLEALRDHAGAIPVLPVVDSMVLADGAHMGESAPREALRRVQTPQAFRFAEIFAAHNAWTGPRDAGDDAQVLRRAGGEVALVDGDECLRKLTFAGDFTMSDSAARTATIALPPMRVGTGFDVHRLVAGEELWLCGLRLAHDKGLSGHSDADVALHAVVDALLGAMALGDIGDHFPPSDPRWKGAASAQFVEHAVGLIGERGYAVGNVDLTIMCEAPKIGPHRQAMRQRLAGLLAVNLESVSVKATTTERLGFTGRGEGIAAQAVATLVRI